MNTFGTFPRIDFEKRKAFVAFSDVDRTCLERLHASLDDLAPGFVDSFYEHLLSFEETRHLLLDDETVNRLKRSQRTYFSMLTAGQYDQDYLENRLRVGFAHAGVGLSPEWYLGAYSHYLVTLLPEIARRIGQHEADFLPTVQALLKIILIDVGLAIDAYIVHRDELIASLRDFETAFANLPFGTLVVSRDLQVMFANRACGMMFDTDSACLQGVSLDQIMDVEVLQSMVDRASYEPKVRAETAFRLFDCPALLAIPVAVTVSELPSGEDRGDDRILIVVEDLRKQTRLEKDLLNAQAVAGIGNWHLNFLTGKVTLSPEAYRIYGWPQDEPFDQASFRRCVHPEDRAEVDAAWKSALTGAPLKIEHRINVESSVRWVETRGKIDRDFTGTPIRGFGTVYDITERKQAESDIERLAFYDTLTGLPNRSQAMARLQRTLEYVRGMAKQAAVLFIDLDRMKEINDTQGHATGDAVLREVGARLGAVLGTGEILGRLGGDEFIAILGPTSEAAANETAARLLRAMVRPITINDMSFTIGMSIGIAVFPKDGESADDLLRNADTAMYSVKGQGGGTALFYDAHMSDKVMRAVTLGRRLEAAIRNKRLELYYQPKVCLDTGALSGVEALVRWVDDELGPISPGEFIPIAEERGLIHDLGDWVLCEASRQVCEWRQNGYDFRHRMAVNISTRQLDAEDFVERTIAHVRGSGIDPSSIELEITETAMMLDPKKALEIAEALVRAGFSLSIDDFGTGYSSLAQLKYFPVDTVKIDRSFVTDMLTDPESLTIVNTIIRMAKALRVRTIAEGVETVSQAEDLHRLECDEAQGYYFGRPMKAQAFAELWINCAK
ncbi:EAL domain-containing protein [Burkholderia vietnamiensis]